MESIQWIIPVTALPAIGLLILSTSSLLISLNREITRLNADREKFVEIIGLKIKQLRRLNFALVHLYAAVLMFLFSSVIAAVTDSANWPLITLLAGLFVMIMAIFYLIIFGYKSISIREKHLKL